MSPTRFAWAWSLFPGYRPTALVLFSLIWFSVGLGLVTQSTQVRAEHPLPLEYLPIEWRVALWWVPALAGLVNAFWPPGKDKWGWALLSIPATFRACSYFVAAIFGWLDATYFISWAVILGILTLLALWPEPVPATVKEVEP
jgi:hypothetical protein